MFVRDELVRPQAIRETALLTVRRARRHLGTASEAAHACLTFRATARALSRARRRPHGIFFGLRWRELVYPRAGFIRKFSDPAHARSATSSPTPRAHRRAQLRRVELDELVR